MKVYKQLAPQLKENSAEVLQSIKARNIKARLIYLVNVSKKETKYKGAVEKFLNKYFNLELITLTVSKFNIKKAEVVVRKAKAVEKAIAKKTASQKAAAKKTTKVAKKKVAAKKVASKKVAKKAVKKVASKKVAKKVAKKSK